MFSRDMHCKSYGVVWCMCVTDSVLLPDDESVEMRASCAIIRYAEIVLARISDGSYSCIRIQHLVR